MQPQSLCWRLTMLAVIVAGLAVIYGCGGPEPAALVDLIQVDSVFVAWGKTGDGSGGTVDYVDHVHTNWP